MLCRASSTKLPRHLYWLVCVPDIRRFLSLMSTTALLTASHGQKGSAKSSSTGSSCPRCGNIKQVIGRRRQYLYIQHDLLRWYCAIDTIGRSNSLRPQSGTHRAYGKRRCIFDETWHRTAVSTVITISGLRNIHHHAHLSALARGAVGLGSWGGGGGPQLHSSQNNTYRCSNDGYEIYHYRRSAIISHRGRPAKAMAK